jgi:hypothetical protein
MIDGSNCTHDAVFPHFTVQNIVFPSHLGPWSLLYLAHGETTPHNVSKSATGKTIRGELTVENLPHATIPPWLNPQ